MHLEHLPSTRGAAVRYSTFFEQGSVEQRQESRLPERVAAVHQFIAAALEASLEAHLPADHPPLRRTHDI